MAITSAQIVRLRKMIDEPTTDTYSDVDLITLGDEVARVVDSTGKAPSATGYVNTYDLYILASEIWRLKAGAEAGKFDFEAEGGAYKRSQVYDNFIAQAVRYAGLSRFSSTTAYQ